MTEPGSFKFGDQSVADAYDNLLVPLMFEPWAKQTLDDHSNWEGKRVLDLAAGTGIVTRLLADRVGRDGFVVALDINPEMLSIARQHMGDNHPNVTFTDSPAHPMDQPAGSVDVLVCQQGFQFFPDRAAVATEIHRVLTPNGKAIVSTWLPVTRCHFFGVICDALDDVGEPEIAQMMRLPFDFIDGAELQAHFENAGFGSMTVSTVTLPFKMPGGLDQAIQVAYATPIGPKLRALPDHQQQQFRAGMTARLQKLSHDGVTMGDLSSNIVVANK